MLVKKATGSHLGSARTTILYNELKKTFRSTATFPMGQWIRELGLQFWSSLVMLRNMLLPGAGVGGGGGVQKRIRARKSDILCRNSPHKWPVTRKMFPFDDVIISWFQIEVRENLTRWKWKSSISLSQTSKTKLDYLTHVTIAHRMRIKSTNVNIFRSYSDNLTDKTNDDLSWAVVIYNLYNPSQNMDH